jgi:DNA mismatch repair protein MSH5
MARGSRGRGRGRPWSSFPRRNAANGSTPRTQASTGSSSSQRGSTRARSRARGLFNPRSARGSSSHPQTPTTRDNQASNSHVSSGVPNAASSRFLRSSPPLAPNPIRPSREELGTFDLENSTGADLSSDTQRYTAVQSIEDDSSIIMAFDMLNNSTIGCAYYNAAEEKLYFMQDSKLGDNSFIETRKYNFT